MGKKGAKFIWAGSKNWVVLRKILTFEVYKVDTQTRGKAANQKSPADRSTGPFQPMLAFSLFEVFGGEVLADHFTQRIVAGVVLDRTNQFRSMFLGRALRRDEAFLPGPLRGA
jgi:hypothetical protein